MSEWKITIEVWPHSSGDGQEADQKAAGERVRNFYIRAMDIDEAARMARCFAEGIEHGPMVWKAPIVAIVKERQP